MLTAYLDESIDGIDGHAVVAGFMGSASSWTACMKHWQRTLKMHDRSSLHMKDLRIRASHKNLLEDLGKIPETCGLRLIGASVDVSGYHKDVKGTFLEVGSEGYLYALQIAVLSALHKVPKGERLEIIFEVQSAYANRRESILTAISMMPNFHDRHGRSKLAKWSSMPKCMILEPADLAAYAMLQQLRDPKSEKTELCAPILETKLWAGLCMTGKRAKQILVELSIENPEFYRIKMTKEQKKSFIKNMPVGEALIENMKDVVKKVEGDAKVRK